MHVLLTVNAAWNVWNFRQPVLHAMLADGHDVTILAPHDQTAEEIERLGCRVLPLEMNVKGLNPIDDLRLLHRFRAVLRRENPDIVLSYTIKNNIFCALAARAEGIPFIPNVTGLGTAFLSAGLLQRVAERLYRKAFGGLPVVFFQNADDRELFVQRRLVGRDQARLLPGSGIDSERFAATRMPPAHEMPVFLLIARLLRDKGVLEFVEAARSVRRDHPGVRFQLLGAAGSQNRSAIDQATVDAWVAEGVVEYLGTTQDVRPRIAAASCVVLPSYREGAPRTLIEAAAMARPVIATDVPGCRAVVDHESSGYLCAVRSAGALAAAMARFLALPAPERARMGRAGRAKMEREFDQAIVVSAYRAAVAVLTGTRAC